MTTPRVDNELYRRLGHAWWDDAVGEFSTIRFFINPVRYGYFERVLTQLGQRPGLELLDVGCGGGILAEEFARSGARVTGIDPAPETVATAQAHAAAAGLSIDYRVGAGERLPLPDAAFDVVACCDVLEHVDDVDRVIAEVARVLRPGGLFFYDTINRTWMSKLAVITIMQEWRWTAFAEPNTHVWEQFITPAELAATLARHGLESRETRGISVTHRNPIAMVLDFHRRVRGDISFQELGRRLGFRESDELAVSYMGYAAKGAVTAART
jgi:2-polyprenyl-6-hydroxyphenyl methylase/3-demethylubiquinone-9 3-methyltransferase